MEWECDCGRLKKDWVNPTLKLLCPLCGSELKKKSVVVQKSLDAFQNLSERKLSGRRKQILDALKELEVASNRELSVFTGLPINSITPRVKELRQMDLVCNAGKVFDKKTMTEVNTWRCKE